jgi:hypothetical protein
MFNKIHHISVDEGKWIKCHNMVDQRIIWCTSLYGHYIYTWLLQEKLHWANVSPRSVWWWHKSITPYIIISVDTLSIYNGELLVCAQKNTQKVYMTKDIATMHDWCKDNMLIYSQVKESNDTKNGKHHCRAEAKTIKHEYLLTKMTDPHP